MVEYERNEGCVAASAAAADHHAIGIDAPAPSQKLRAIDTVVDVDDAPFQVKSVPVDAAKTAAASAIHVEHGNASAR
jgi:hypothetical protein